MQFLTALLAFAGVMALMSTIIAVLIEAFIAGRGLRLSGLRRLLQNYYRDAVVPRLPPGAQGAAADLNRAAREFATSMVANPARLGRSGTGGGGRYTHLTPRQLIEQLARTSAGAALLGLSDADLRPRLEALSYEFDRLSDGARTFFTRRTRVFSVLLAMVFAFGLNIDALRLYKVLSTDAATREAIIRWTDNEIATRGDDAGTREGATEDDLSELITLLGTMSIPVGYSQYPYCLEYSSLHGVVEPGDVVFDPRCARVRERTDTLTTQEGRAALEQQREISLQPEWAIWMAKTGEKAFAFVPEIYRTRIHFDTWVWFFSTLVSGGMIGLGAPFWFNVYRKLASLIPVVGAANAVAASLRGQQPQGEARQTPPSGGGPRDDVNVRGADIVVAARTAAGQSPEIADPTAVAAPNITGSSPPGGPIGPGSAQRVVAATAAAEGTAAPLRVRRLRG